MWGTYTNTWEDTGHNYWGGLNGAKLGVWLETFNIAARVWANLTSPSGGLSRDTDERQQQSMAWLVKETRPQCVLMVRLLMGRGSTHHLSMLLGREGPGNQPPGQKRRYAGGWFRDFWRSVFVHLRQFTLCQFMGFPS